MKTVNTAVRDAIRSEYSITAIPRLTVEWNLNAYANTVVDNIPAEADEGYDIEMFPIESIVKANRPTAGVMKARVGEAKVADPYSQYDGKARSARYYLASVDDTYKYWTSPVQTNGSGVFPTHTDGESKVRPYVTYTDGVKTNRIVIGFEDTWAQPKDFLVRVKTTPTGAWTTVSTNPVINSKGQAIINYNGTSWSVANTPGTATTTIYGIQVRVDSLRGVLGGSIGGTYSYLSLIEISARRVHDLSDRLISVSDTFDMAEKSFIYPVGTITSNTASVNLFNGDGELNSDSTDSAYAGLLEPNAVFNLEYIYTIGTTSYSVQQFKMYAGSWAGQRSDNVSVDCTDYSKFFQEVKPRATAYQNLSAPEIIWRICDSIGFVDYEIQRNDLTTEHKIPIWWCDGELTAWELFDEIAKATQTAIYFDGNGKLQVRTRDAAFNKNAATSWTLRGTDTSTDLADIVTIDQSDELSSNKVKITYKKTDIDPVINGQSKTQILWEPEGTVALRACPLFKDLTIGDTFISLAPDEAKIWPFEGMMNVQGELIKYKGKQFVYYEAGTRKYATVESQEEMEKFNNKTAADSRYQNHYTGNLKIEERGVWNSTEANHKVDVTGYSVRNIINGNRNTDVSGFNHDKKESRVVLNSGNRYGSNDLLVATRGIEADTGFYYYGVRIKFEKDGAHKHQRAGLLIHNNTNNEDGYYIDLTTSNKLASGKKRAERKEMELYSRVGGTWKSIGSGQALAIEEGIDYDIDVQYKAVGSDHQITVWVNGKKCFSETISGANKNPWNGRFGLFSRGDTKASFEYLYAIRREEETEPSDDFSFLNKIKGGYHGDQLIREWVFRERTVNRRIKKKWPKAKPKFNITYYDEFGPICHEIREYEVDFNIKPAITSRLYMGNDYSAICPEYRADSFSARFYIANTTRSTAIVNGDDTLVYAGQSTAVHPVLAVIGRSITVEDDETVEAKNEEQIRRRGEIETEISSQWIQSKKMAQEIADWIKDHWSIGADEQSVVIFGNPLLEIGDIVVIEYPQLDMTSVTHKYFVVGISNSFDAGLETTLTLRRVV